ncbi:hypothetical protein EVAR_231_1 [Eumeta japonica]|uniref:Uncharacterized protein n=1 Tax=Eumeta variegata TaxID=151549 RepID=A0A4C1SCC1_EUMVA|nr:hypothetical protein EVAR_231_1 [Eumeta japonica]
MPRILTAITIRNGGAGRRVRRDGRPTCIIYLGQRSRALAGTGRNSERARSRARLRREGVMLSTKEISEFVMHNMLLCSEFVQAAPAMQRAGRPAVARLRVDLQFVTKTSRRSRRQTCECICTDITLRGLKI